MTSTIESLISEINTLDIELKEIINQNEKEACELVRLNNEEMYLQSKIDKLENIIVLSQLERENFSKELIEFDLYRLLYEGSEISSKLNKLKESERKDESTCDWYLLYSI